MPNETNPAQIQRTALMEALAAQQGRIEAQDEQISKLTRAVNVIARYAGLTERLADVNNPASPVPDPASQAAPESTEQALDSSAHDNVSELGSTPGANEHVPAEKTTTPLQPGVEIPTSPFNNLIDVTAPVSGTETHVPNDQTRIETDVRVGNPDNPQKAFEWNMGGGDSGARDVDVSKRSANRTFASLKLARLRVIAGVERGEELEIAGRIEADASLSDELIAHETNILDSMRINASRQQTPRNLVPRTAAVDGERSAPSLAGAPGVGLGQIVASLDGTDTEDSDLFLGGFASE